MDKAVGKVKQVSSVAYQHKYKLIFLFGTCYVAKKGYDLYKFVKPLLEIKNMVNNG